LHLCGYKDKTTAQVKVMRAKEDAALKKISWFYCPSVCDEEEFSLLILRKLNVMG
jgi:hypothetical protein